MSAALRADETTLKLTKTKLGDDHSDTLESLNKLARAYTLAGQHDKALPLYEETLKIREATLGDDYADILTAILTADALRIDISTTQTQACRVDARIA